jgi:Protein of unknown function (DUF3108)
MSSPTHSDSNTTDDTRHRFATEIVRRQGLFASPQRKLIAALILSVIAHFIAGLFVDVEPFEEKIQPLTAKFVKLPPPPPPAVAVAPTAKPKAKAKPKPKVDKTAVVAALPTTVETPFVEAAPVAEEKAPEPVAQKEPEPAPKEEPKTEPEPPAPVAEAKPEEPPARLPPKKIELAYTAYLGEQKFEVGPVNLQFTHDNGRYKLKVTGRGRGLAALLYPGTFTGESEGTITKEGLRPDKFIEERGNPDKRREVSFDHVTKMVKMPDKEPILFEGAPHDPLTWIVQFYFAAPNSHQNIFTVASSRRLDVYNLDLQGDETLETPVGMIKTQLWKGSRKPDAEGKRGGSAQFWLSPEWHYVPFKIKVVNAQGRSASFELTAVNAE